jgi:hypothetical protein
MIHPFFRSIVRKAKRGGAAYASGAAYEHAVRDQLNKLCYKGERVQVSDPAGANPTAHDLVLLNLNLTLEVKTHAAVEGGGCKLPLSNDAFQLPPDSSVLRSFLPSDLILWNGKVPSCLNGDRSVETWKAEKSLFKGVYIPAPSSAVAEYYRAKGTMYMQIKGRGLYHTGDDVLGWGVPKFEPECSVRIRLKQHGSGSVPQDCQACFNYKPKTLLPTPYDFMDPTRLPPGFTLAGE